MYFEEESLRERLNMRLWLTLVLWLGSSLVLTEESPPPSKRHKCPDASPSQHLLCYHEGNISTGDLDPCICTHIVLPSVESPKGYRLDEKVASSALSDLRARNPSLRLLLGVDAGSRALHSASDKKVSDFCRETADYIKSANLDGLEVDLGEANDDSTHTRRKESVVSLFKSLRESVGHANPKESDGGQDSILLLRLPVRPEALAKTYDLKPLSKYVDYFTVSTHNITDSSEKDVTFHHSRLMGLADILNTDSVLDMLTGLGAPPTKLIISLPTHGLSFTLKNENENVARSPVAGAPKVINYEQVCSMMKEGGWTVERDEDLTAPYAFRNKTWMAFDDETSVTIKGKYSLLRGLGGVAISTIDADDQSGACGRGPFPLTRVLKDTLTKLSRKPRGLILQSLEEELRGGVSVALPEASLDSSVRLSPFRIVRVVDREGNVHVSRRDAETRFHCSRQGYFMHPLGCNMFYRCVKFDQLSNDFSVYEYDCGPGLVFDEKWEVCVHPSQRSGPCHGSSEIQPVPRAKFTCPAEGYYADPENCRWFFACLDHHGDPSVAGRDATDPHSGLTAYEFRCPFGLAFDGTRLACEWPWSVPGCGKVEIGSGVLAAIQPTGYSISGVGGVIGSVGIGGALHHTSHVTSHLESGSVASVVGVADKGAGFVAGGGSQIGLGESGSVASIFSAGDAGHVASGGAKIEVGGVRFGSGRSGLGSSYVSHGPGFVTGRVGIVSQGVELVSQGQNLVSSGPGLVSGSGGLLSGSGGLLSGSHGVISSGAQLASGGAQLLSEGVQVLTGGGQLLSGGARISNLRPVSGVESGSVASVFGVSKAGEGTFSSGAEHTGLGGVGVAIDDSHVASGGSLYSSGGSRGSFLSSGSVGDSSFSSGGGRTSYYSSGGLRTSQYHGGSSRGTIVSSESADSIGSVHVTPGEIAITSDGLGSSVGGAEISSGVAHSISSGEKILNVQSYQTPALKFETSAPAVGVSYTSSSSIPTGGISFNLGHSIATGGKSFTTGSSVVAGAEEAASRNQAKPLEIVGVTSGGIGRVDNIHLSVEGVEANGGDVNGIGLSGVGISGVGVGGASVGRFGISGVQVIGDGVSGVRGIGSGLGFQSITTEAPSIVGVSRGVPLAPVIHSNYDDSPKYTVSISTPSTTSRPIPVVTPSVQLVTPAPIQYQSPQPAFLAHETYHSSAPATGSGSNSFSAGSLSDGNDDFSSRQPGSRAGATGSGRSHYSFRQRVDYQSRSNQPQYYHSPSGALGTSSYSIDSGAQRTSGFVPIKPLVSSNVFTASESPVVTLTHSPAFEAARVSSIGGSEGGSVVNALSQESLSSPDKGVLVDNSQDGIGFGLVRDDGHTVTGDGASRPSLVGVQRGYQEQLRSSVTAPETEFSYKDLPISIYQAAPPARTFDVSGVGNAFHQAPKRVFSTTNVTPAPALKLAVNAVHPSTFITPSTTPGYEEINEDISRQLENKEFSYKNIFPVVELSTPAPKVVDIPQVSIQNQLNFEKRIYNPVFTSTVSPPTSIGIDDGNYGSRIVYTSNAKQPAAFTSSHGSSGLRHFVQTESPTISYSPTFTQTTPIQHTQSVPVTPASTVFVSTTPAPLSTLSYSKLPSTPIAPASPVYYIPQRGSPRHRYFSTTTASPILAEAFPGGEDSHQEVQFFEPNRVTQNIPITSTFGPPVGSLSLIPAINDSAFGGRALPAFKQSTFRGYGRLSTGESDNEGSINLSVGVQGSYEDVLLKQAQVKDDDESQVPVIIDSINAGRGHYRYRGRNGRVRTNGKKKCDDDDENRDEADVNPDAILDSFSGNYGSILDNGQRDALVQGIISEDLREKTSGSLNDYQGLNNGGLQVGVTVKSSLDNGELGRSRSRPRGRYQNENVNYHSNFKSSTAQPAEYTSGVRNTYTLSTVPTVVPIVSSTIGYVSEGDYQSSGINLASGIGDLQSEINSKYSGGLSEGLSNLGSSRRLSQGLQRGGFRGNSDIQLKSSNQRAESFSESLRKSSESSSSIDHAAVIVLPCGKLPALLAKLGAVTEALRSIQEEETSSTLTVTQERSRASLSLPPVDRYRNGDWNLIEKSLGNDMCKRAGLFRHPQDCNRFYECYWDEWKGRYSLHEFKCPIRLAYDDSLSACNWPTSGPACSANKLLV